MAAPGGGLQRHPILGERGLGQAQYHLHACEPRHPLIPTARRAWTGRVKDFDYSGFGAPVPAIDFQFTYDLAIPGPPSIQTV